MNYSVQQVSERVAYCCPAHQVYAEPGREGAWLFGSDPGAQSEDGRGLRTQHRRWAHYTLHAQTQPGCYEICFSIRPYISRGFPLHLQYILYLYVANSAASVNKARHSQPPVGSKVLREMYKKYNESWVVELLFDDLLDWNVSL